MYMHRVLIENNCCGSAAYKSIKVKTTTAVDKENFAIFVNGSPSSAVAKHTFGRTTNVLAEPEPIVLTSVSQGSETQLIRSILQNNALLTALELNEFILSDELSNYYNTHVTLSLEDSINIVQASLYQTGHVWHYERSKRVTGTSCYGLFTYTKNKNPDWNRKLHIHTKLKQDNKNFKYGRETEKLALKAYCISTGEMVKNLGFVINPKAAWMGCSPDGYIHSKKKLIEIKCPTTGEDLNLEELIPTIKYIVKHNNNWELKQNHHYYGQVQFNMLILGCTSADFVIYSKRSDANLVINVPFNLEFVLKMVRALKTVYFDRMLPFYFEHNI